MTFSTVNQILNNKAQAERETLLKQWLNVIVLYCGGYVNLTDTECKILEDNTQKLIKQSNIDVNKLFPNNDIDLQQIKETVYAIDRHEVVFTPLTELLNTKGIENTDVQELIKLTL